MPRAVASLARRRHPVPAKHQYFACNHMQWLMQLFPVEAAKGGVCYRPTLAAADAAARANRNALTDKPWLAVAQDALDLQKTGTRDRLPTDILASGALDACKVPRETSTQLH